MEPWQNQLTEALKNSPRTVILGVGNDLKADDGVGPYIINQLQNRVPESVELINASTVPENFIAHLCDTNPSLTLIVDAALMKEPPGTIRLIDKDNIGGVAFSTHQLPLTFFIEYLLNQIDTTILILGIQPLNVAFAEPITPPVQAAAEKIVKTITEIQ
jgi:hydrogenase 3 maturation protease